MDEIIKTIFLEYDKTALHIDLVKHISGKFYVSIKQTFLSENENRKSQTIKINPAILNDIVEVLAFYKKQVPGEETNVKNYFSGEIKEEMKKRYLKGVDIKDLALQFDCSEDIIEQFLRNANLKITSNKLPKRNRRSSN